MRQSLVITLLVAVAGVALAVLATALWLDPPGPPLASAEWSLSRFTPNADGVTDVTRLRYTLRRPAQVSIQFVDSAGQRYLFREARPRAAGESVVDFSGIVQAFVRPGEALSGTVLARVLPNGPYTWEVTARDATGQQNTLTGTLTVAEADTTLPDLLNLTVSPAVFTPNQDGVNDRVQINVYLAKDVAEDGLQLALVGPDGTTLPIAEKPGAIRLGERGLHAYDFDGGIDQGENPPPDGVYTVRATATDRLGQRVQVTQTLTIERGGLPRAEIYLGAVDYSASTLVQGQTLFFTLTVYNYGTAPIRTSGPEAGYIYTSMRENFNTVGAYEQSGVFRVGVMCQTCKSDYPWRWALGSAETLTKVEEDGGTFFYVLPGQRVVVTGGVTLDEIVPSRNPQAFWVGLIHEDVAIAAINNRVAPTNIFIAEP